MKLLFDENLSPRLVALLRADHPGCKHVRDVGLRGAADERIWEFARSNDFVVVSKDNDFRQRSFVAGAPPKVVWLDVGNDGTAAVSALLTRSRALLTAFEADSDSALLVLSALRSLP